MDLRSPPPPMPPHERARTSLTELLELARGTLPEGDPVLASLERVAAAFDQPAADDHLGAGCGTGAYTAPLPVDEEQIVTCLRVEARGGDRRREPRILFETRVSFLGPRGAGEGRSFDISPGGMFLATERPPAVGSVLALGFVLPGALEVAARAAVRWVRARQASAARPAGAGLEFLELPEVARGAIARVAAVASSPGGRSRRGRRRS
jgi:uncharacterized protein (TIGR02266 family)